MQATFRINYLNITPNQKMFNYSTGSLIIYESLTIFINCIFIDSEDDSPPPPVPTRPENTRSIHTKSLLIPQNMPIIEHKEPKTVRIDENGIKRRSGKKEDEAEKMRAVLKILRTIVSVGDPDLKYENYQKIGQGASGTVYTAEEIATGRQV
jgi:hypothetical protein